jgi:hypothetical protein
VGKAIDAQPLSMSVLKYMRHMQRNPYKNIAAINIPDELREPLEQLLTRYINFLLERQVNSSNFIKMVRNGK